jgi:hypothetical protein
VAFILQLSAVGVKLPPTNPTLVNRALDLNEMNGHRRAAAWGRFANE